MLRRVEKVQFDILGPDETRRYSAVEILYTDLYESPHDDQPKDGGLLDLRMGPCDSTRKCLTCGGTNKECPGHFGHIELAAPVYHVGWLRACMHVLRCICFGCYKLLVDPKRVSKLKSLSDKSKLCCKVKKCNDCSHVQPSIGQSKIFGDTIRLVVKRKTKMIDFTAKDTYEHLQKISEKDYRALGFKCPPHWMILTVLPVSPPCIRPTMIQDGKHSHNDITMHMIKILKASLDIKKAEECRLLTKNAIDTLQFNVATLVNNDLTKMPQATLRNNTAIVSIGQRLKGKEGRVRCNLMGKRVDFSGRTVITPDPNMAVDQVGIPKSIAKTLTFPERVNHLNYEKLYKLVKRGDDYPGAKCVITEDGDKINLKHNKDRLQLQMGSIVERHLVDDDVVLFNRQPTLHKMSMMGHRIKVLPWSTFRMNLSVTTPYNADFDGDEMNLHAPQSERTRAELEENLMVSKNLLTSQSSKPIMGIVQDTLTAVRKMTRRDMFIEKEDLMNLLMYFPQWNGKIPAPAILKPKCLWTGKQLFSILLPTKLSLVKTTSEWFCPTDITVIIRGGTLHCGMMCKKSLGQSAGGIMHIVAKEFIDDTCVHLYNNIQLVVDHWIMINGQSIGISDTIADEKTYRAVEKRLVVARHGVTKIIQDAHLNRLGATPGNTFRETFENKVNAEMNRALDDTGTSTQKSLSEFNNFKAMSLAGSKGNTTNISQVIACVGQQNVGGKRIPFGFRYRTLPHFVKDDYGPESCGFVSNSYLTGLTPEEFFFHAMGGREGLIDTAVKTAITGYIQRRLVKLMEGCRLEYDETVRNASGQLIQYHYGEDGMDGARVESQRVPMVSMDDTAFREMYKHKNLSFEYGKAVRQEYMSLKHDRVLFQKDFNVGKDTVIVPCNIQRVIEIAEREFSVKMNCVTKMTPAEVIDTVKTLEARLPNDNTTTYFKCYLHSILASKRVIEEYGLTKEALDYVVGEVESRFQLARAYPGEAVGVLAAISLGEPATQMTLNTFHYAGVSSKNVTLGVPRLEEIINVSEKPKTPSLTIFLKGHAKRNEKLAYRVANRLGYVTLGDITVISAIYYDPDPMNTCVSEDLDFVEMFYATEDINMDTISPWMLRIELQKERLHGLTMQSIDRTLTKEFGDKLAFVMTDDMFEKRVIRIRLNSLENQNNDDDISSLQILRQFEQKLLMSTPLRGIEEIKKVYLSKPETDKSKMSHRINSRGKPEYKANWMLETDGSNLQAVLADPEVDQRRTFSNDITETFEVLGIEAARATIEREITDVISFGGSYVSYRHLSLLCDVMTTRGGLTSINRFGLGRVNPSPMMKATFEQTVDMFMNAAISSTRDPLCGISENIMVGNLVPVGTGTFDLLVDESNLEEAKETMQTVQIDFGTPEPAITPDYPWSPSHDEGQFSPTVQYSPSCETPEQYSPTAALYDDLSYSSSVQFAPLPPEYNEYKQNDYKTLDYSIPEY